ncbi:MAG: cytochrome c-type biogenesis protein CcmH [Myxococcales bacterium]|nr:cytochrome c-type biogenesis protein CcmH [Myxococcales bacterium]MDP3503464.1 cytochrome c-type biogenesis protein CcmH [Myxococcales bacterium]
MTLALLVSLMLGQGYAPQRQGLDPLEAEKEARVMRLGKQLRCAVCQGVSIADSPASMARAQLDKVRELVSENKSDDEIYAYFIERYGEWVLLQPTTGGLNSVLWLGPLALLGIGLIVIVMQSKKSAVMLPMPQTAAAAEGASPAPTSDDALLAQVRADQEK